MRSRAAVPVPIQTSSRRAETGGVSEAPPIAWADATTQSGNEVRWAPPAQKIPPAAPRVERLRGASPWKVAQPPPPQDAYSTASSSKGEDTRSSSSTASSHASAEDPPDPQEEPAPPPPHVFQTPNPDEADTEQERERRRQALALEQQQMILQRVAAARRPKQSKKKKKKTPAPTVPKIEKRPEEPSPQRRGPRTKGLLYRRLPDGKLELVK